MFPELRSVPFHVAAEGSGRQIPIVTVGIPTFRRSELLAQAVQSVLAQNFDRPFELLITDNDPASRGAASLLDRVPALRQHAFRYVVNGTNVGHCQNVNRCIDLARSSWVTVLHDDDLLKPQALIDSFRELDRDPAIDGIVGAKATLDERAERPDFIDLTLGGRLRALLKIGLNAGLYGGHASRLLTTRKFFWGPVAGNVAGFVFRKTCALELGGLDPNEEPNSDYWFYTRFADRFHLRQHRRVVATVRIAVNESAKPEVIRGMFSETHRFRRSLAQCAVPRWWRYLSPFLLARSRIELRDLWGVEISAEEIGRLIGGRLPGHHPYLIWSAKFLMRGF